MKRAIVALLIALAGILAWSGVPRLSSVSAHSPHPGLDINIGVQGSCDTWVPAADLSCALPSATTFRLDFYLDALPQDIPNYDGFGAYLEYSGVVAESNPTFLWPDCVFPFENITSTAAALGCVVGLNSHSSYSGPMASLDFHCVNSGFIRLVHGSGYTELLNNEAGQITSHSEGGGSETLLINCDPPHDNFAYAYVAPSKSFTYQQSTIFGTTEVGERTSLSGCSNAPEPTGQIGATVWFRYTASQSGTLHVATLFSDFDTVLVIYTGGSLPSLVRRACDDDGGGTQQLTSQTSVAVTAGTAYYFQIGGYNGSSGQLVLDVELEKTPTPTWTPTRTPTWTPTWNPTDTPTYTPTYTPTQTELPRPTDTPTYTPTNTPIPTLVPSPTQRPATLTPIPTVRHGDANNDGRIDSIDVSLIFQFSVGLIPVPNQAADANKDGRINAVDGQLILQYSAGLLRELPPP